MVLEATYGWYWAADALAELGATVHLAHPLGVKAFTYRRVKNDQRDAADLADLLRMGRLPHAWISPPQTRELRELVRHRAKLVAIRSRCKAEVHAVLAKAGIWVPMTDLFGVAGNQLLDDADGGPYRARVASLRRLIEALDFEIELFTRSPAAGWPVTRLPRGPADPRHRAGAGRGVRRRDRGRAPIPRPGAADLVGRAHPAPPRIRHHRAPRPDHQAGLAAGAVGRDRVGEDPARQPASVPSATTSPRAAAVPTSAPWRPRADNSSSSTTRCAITRCAPCTPHQPRAA